MESGKLNKKIKFMVKDKGGTDDDGYPLQGEKIVKECWASVRGLRGREFYGAAAVQSENDMVFNCRYFSGLQPNMQIKYNNVLFDIKSINDLNEKHTEYEIHASEVKQSG